MSIDRPVIRRPGQNAGIFGLRGSGKTTLVHRLIGEHPRVLIVDPQREYGDVAVEVRSTDELIEYLEQTAGSWRVAYFNTSLEMDFDRLCAIAWEVGNLLFVVEEADRFCNPSWIGDRFFEIVNYGRHAPGGELAGTRPVDYLITSRSPANVSREVTRQAYEAYCFTISEPRDIEWLKDWLGPAYVTGLADLPPHHYRFRDLYDRSRGMQELETVR